MIKSRIKSGIRSATSYLIGDGIKSGIKSCLNGDAAY